MSQVNTPLEREIRVSLRRLKKIFYFFQVKLVYVEDVQRDVLVFVRHICIPSTHCEMLTTTKLIDISITSCIYYSLCMW